MSAKDEFDEYGNPIGFVPDSIKTGDKVSYIDTRSVKIPFCSNCGAELKNGSKAESRTITKTIKVKLFGIWDGEKVELDDPEHHTVVRTINWLKKEE